MNCQPCNRPALFLEGPAGDIPMCLDCSRKLYELHVMKQAELERQANNTLARMEAVAGVKIGGYYAPRPAPKIIAPGLVLTNIHPTESQVGVINTGSIRAIDGAITVVRNAGDATVASKLAHLTEGITSNTDLSNEQKREALDLLSVIAKEAAVEPAQRRPAVVRAISVDFAQLVSGVASAAQLWAAHGPAIKAFFGL